MSTNCIKKKNTVNCHVYHNKIHVVKYDMEWENVKREPNEENERWQLKTYDDKIKWISENVN